MRPRRFFCMAFPLCLAALVTWGAGCASTKGNKYVERTGIMSWSPHLLFLNRAPHDSLYVEVDVVAGTEPSDEVLEGLEEFLRRYCDKPRGITVIRDDTIPRSAAVGYDKQALALQYVDGPSTTNESPAFLYVLYYDSALQVDPSTPLRAAHQHVRLRTESRYVDPENPHVNLQPYPTAIYVDRRYLRLMPRIFEMLTIRHEAAHVLGLTRNTAHGVEYHCMRKSCVMAPHLNVGFFKLICGQNPFSQTNFCDACESDLAQGTAEPARNVRFVGPTLVRSEKEYYVASLPAEIKLGAGDVARFELAKFLEQARGDGKRMKGQFNPRYWADFSRDPSEVERQIKAIASAQCDPLPMVRYAATQFVARAKEAVGNAKGRD